MKGNGQQGPLAGLRIIDSNTMVAMPTGMHILADMGAEVVKVDSHTVFRTEEARVIYADNDPGDQPWNREGSFNTLQRSKLGVTLNLKTPQGIELFKELVAISDVLVENNRAGTMERLGLGYDEMKKIRPDLIYVSNTGFGHTGPWRRYAGIGRMFELTCGLSQFTGYTDEGPRRVGKAFFDLHVGWMVVFAIMSALHHRQKTGRGQWIDFAMYQVGVSTMGDAVLDFIANGRNGKTMGNRHPSIAPHGVYPCKGDDKWVAISCENDQQWESLVTAMGSPSWATDEKFSDSLARWKNQDELDKNISQWTRHFENLKLTHMLQGVGLPAMAVMNSRELLTDEHMKARGFYEKVEHPAETKIGTKLYFGRPWKMSKTPSFIRRPAPNLGEHNEEIIGDLLGRSRQEMERLYELGVCGTVPDIKPTYKPPSYDQQMQEGTLTAIDTDYRKILGLE
ncbi:MAG: CoA transferase [SAR202 cluster bacterium]|nr:CoA transferase [SAR202 cluster bacterium]